MSQHIICVPCEQSGGLVRIQLGWEKPMSEFYFVVFVEPQVGQQLDEDDDTDEDEIVYSSLDDRLADGQKTLTYFKAIAARIGCEVPDALWRAAYQDQEFNVVNKVCHYSPTGEPVEPY
ncbi:hypothetical protein RYB68_06955 [Pseudomonas syringae pv. actinidiae]|nr:hypothetical protein [Pseudomonas syringae pv. actinidiae]